MDAHGSIGLAAFVLPASRRVTAVAAAVIALAALGALMPRARAQMSGHGAYNRSSAIWKRMDACRRQAWKQHPDYAPEGKAKRDRAVRRCLEANNLPPAAPLVPEPPAARSGSSR